MFNKILYIFSQAFCLFRYTDIKQHADFPSLKHPIVNMSLILTIFIKLYFKDWKGLTRSVFKRVIESISKRHIFLWSPSGDVLTLSHSQENYFSLISKLLRRGRLTQVHESRKDLPVTKWRSDRLTLHCDNHWERRRWAPLPQTSASTHFIWQLVCQIKHPALFPVGSTLREKGQ